MDPDTNSWANWIIGFVVVVALVGLLLLARGPSDQDHVQVPMPAAVLVTRA